MLLKLDHIDIAYADVPVIRDVSLGLEDGDIGCLLGPSGCGKTTLLRAIAGFEKVKKGKIMIQHGVVSSPQLHVPPEKRRIGMVFQDFALFPHLNVADNISFGIRKMASRSRLNRVNELLRLVGLAGYGNQYPHQLSGGQQQRIAIARAMAPRPNLLLMDEPFSSLDVELREQLVAEIRSILKQEKITAILVTHDQYEAFTMADKIGVINGGQLEQWDTAYNLYHQPQSRFVADFIGQGVMMPGKVINSHQVDTELGVIDGKVPEGCEPGCPVDILVRPDDIVHDDHSKRVAEVVDKRFRGADFLYTLRLESGGVVLCLTPSHHDHAIGERIGIQHRIEHLVLFRRDNFVTHT
ncbi:MAG: ABC transporter ATP-binding protein [Gammaproteobacteria bacterium]|nr:ABC transporter ATP-binding protein [Gammaproteobacteria bacterium]